MESRISKDAYYIELAKTTLLRSTCIKRQYGAVIVNQDEVVSTGYNGPPRGEKHCTTCKRLQVPSNGNDYSECHSVHAEMNAIISASRKEMIGSTLYLAGTELGRTAISAFPCQVCRRLIKNAGIQYIVCAGEDGKYDRYSVNEL